MISYIIKSILISGALLLIYHVFLEKEKMHRFNRAYLLFAILFSLVAPVLSFTFYSPITTASEEYLAIPDAVGPGTSMRLTMKDTPAGPSAFLLLYVIASFILLIRLSGILYRILSTIRKNKIQSAGAAKFVLVDKDISPHTFLHYIFLPEKEFTSNTIEPEIIGHEMAHVRQKHSLDILFLELVQVLCWFNPILFLYRRAIQLNHEFLADDAVIEKHSNTTSYQYLLLGRSGKYSRRPLPSHFNFFIIKKRLTMMTKTTTRTKALLMQLAVVPLLAGILLVFCTKSNAQDSVSKKAPNMMIPEHTIEGISDELMNEFNSIIEKHKTTNSNGHEVYSLFSTEEQAHLEEIYKKMSREQQKNSIVIFMPLGKPLPKVVPTAKQFEDFQNPRQYGVWINEKKVNNEELKKYKHTDFSQVFISRLYGAARSSVTYNFQVDLMTNDYYQDYYTRQINNKRYMMLLRMPDPHNAQKKTVGYILLNQKEP